MKATFDEVGAKMSEALIKWDDFDDKGWKSCLTCRSSFKSRFDGNLICRIHYIDCKDLRMPCREWEEKMSQR